MTLHLWFAFVGAASALLLIPGPTIMLVIGYALGEGRRSAAATAVGVVLGDFTAMTLSLVGLGAVLASSAALFGVLKWAGAAYLIYLGVRLWRTDPEAAGAELARSGRSSRAMLGHAYAVTALNPKGIAFFVAFVPQFIAPGAPVLPQLVVLEATFLVLALLNTLGYALLAARVREAISRPAIRRGLNRLSGSILIGAGVATAAIRRST